MPAVLPVVGPPLYGPVPFPKGICITSFSCSALSLFVCLTGTPAMPVKPSIRPAVSLDSRSTQYPEPLPVIGPFPSGPVPSKFGIGLLLILWDQHSSECSTLPQNHLGDLTIEIGLHVTLLSAQRRPFHSLEESNSVPGFHGPKIQRPSAFARWAAWSSPYRKAVTTCATVRPEERNTGISAAASVRNALGPTLPVITASAPNSAIFCPVRMPASCERLRFSLLSNSQMFRSACQRERSTLARPKRVSIGLVSSFPCAVTATFIFAISRLRPRRLRAASG